jgi:type II secretory pathway component PulK
MIRSGSILILVLFVLTVLSLTAVSLAYRTGLGRRSATHATVMAKLRAQAHSAVAVAIAQLIGDDNDFDHPAEAWCSHRPFDGDAWLDASAAAQEELASQFTADYAVIDEESKLHISYASSEALDRLGMTSEQVAALLDWMDDDGVARSEGGEDAFYAKHNPPYLSKNAPLETLNELLLIRGFTGDNFYGEDANHNRRLDPNENDGGVNWPVDDADGRLRSGWVDLLTCVTDGRINVNTTSQAVLHTLPLSRQAIDQIIGYRQFDGASQGLLETHAFRAVKDLEQLQGLSANDVEALKQIATFRSRWFRIFAFARHSESGLDYELQVLVRREGGDVEVASWRQR